MTSESKHKGLFGCSILPVMGNLKKSPYLLSLSIDNLRKPFLDLRWSLPFNQVVRVLWLSTWVVYITTDSRSLIWKRKCSRKLWFLAAIWNIHINLKQGVLWASLTIYGPNQQMFVKYKKESINHSLNSVYIWFWS